MPAMVSAVTVTVPPKIGADFFSQHFSREHKREKLEKRKAKYFKATSDHFLTFKV